MIFQETYLRGAFVIEPETHGDEQGYFARTWCAREAAEHGLLDSFVQFHVSSNRSKGTLRGMHDRADPHGEAKPVRCTRGAMFDVIIDMREESPTRHGWFAVELTAETHRQLSIPVGFAHGFQAVVDDTEVFYQVTGFYHPEAARGVRWDDPLFAIEWPLEVTLMSDHDRRFPRIGSLPVADND